MISFIFLTFLSGIILFFKRNSRTRDSEQGDNRRSYDAWNRSREMRHY